VSRAYAIFLTCCLAYFLSYFFRSANAVIAPDLSAELGLRAESLGLMTSLFFGVFALMQPLVGAALDRWGPRWVPPALILVGAGGSLVFASAQSLLLLTVGRALIGIGMSAILMGSLKALSLWFPANRFATFSGLLMGVGSAGALAAATPLALLSDAIGWRSAFTLGAGVLLVMAALIVLVVRNTPPGVEWPRAEGGPMSFFALFRDARVWRMGILYFFMAGVLLGVQGLWAGPYLYDVVGLNKVAVGNTLLVLGIGSVLGYAATGRLGDRFGTVPVLLTGCAVFLACLAALAAGVPAALVPLVYFLFGFSGSSYVLLFAQGRAVFPPDLTARAVSALNMLGVGGIFVLQALFGAVVGSFPMDAARQYPPAAYSLAFLVLGVGTLAALIFYLPFAGSLRGQSRAPKAPVAAD
jgi:MFS family permease